MAEFAKESDRAAVILVASLFENALGTLLRHHFVPTTTGDDELIEGATAPLGTLSARINISRRVGLVSSKFTRDLHLIRRIRNEFAHNVQGCSFEAGAVRARVLELAKSSQLLERIPIIRAAHPAGPRGDFLLIASWMLYSLNQKIETCCALSEADEEWGYDEHAFEETLQNRIDEDEVREVAAALPSKPASNDEGDS